MKPDTSLVNETGHLDLLATEPVYFASLFWGWYPREDRESRVYRLQKVYGRFSLAKCTRIKERLRWMITHPDTISCRGVADLHVSHCQKKKQFS
jgi:hypothetical protein